MSFIVTEQWALSWQNNELYRDRTMSFIVTEQKRVLFFGPLVSEDEGTTIFRNVENTA